MFNVLHSNLNYFKESLSAFSDEVPQLSNPDNPSLLEVSKIAHTLGVTLDELINYDFVAFDKLKLADIKFLVIDVDGVLTDAGLYYTESGDFWKKFNARDGRGVIELRKKGFEVGIISSSTNNVLIEKRAEVMKVERIYAGELEKAEVLKDWCQEMELDLSQVAFMGDDINDLKVMEAVGFVACPRDSAPEVKQLADLILSSKGGDGCVREFIDKYLRTTIGI